MTAEGKELVKLNLDGYLPVRQDPERLKAVIRTNLGDSMPSAFDLQRIRMPAAGGKMWSVPTPSGDATRPNIEGIVVVFQACRGWWPGAYGGNRPPQCTSPDRRTGFGNPGGDCGRCLHAQWGTAVNQVGEATRGQACKSIVRLFVVTEGIILPYMLSLPPTSLRGFRAYLVKRTMVPESYRAVVTRIGLETDTNDAGNKYSRATFERVGALDGEAAARIEEYVRSIEPLLTVPVTAGDYVTDDEASDVDL